MSTSPTPFIEGATFRRVVIGPSGPGAGHRLTLAARVWMQGR